MRVEKKRTKYGSQGWLQIAVNRCPTVIDDAIRDAGIELTGEIEWLSPLESDDFAEYTDGEFMDQLGIQLLQRPLERLGLPSDSRWHWDSGELALFVNDEVIAILRPRQWRITDMDNGARDIA